MKSNNLKKAAVLGLATIMLVPSATFAKEFKDVRKDNKYAWAYNAIDVLSDKNVISGHPDGEFKPGDSVSLEELLQLIKQVLNPSADEIKTAKEKYSKTAKDNGVNSWAEDAICLALHRGYLNESALKKAYERGFFKINGREYPSRSDIAIFFARALNLNANGNTTLLRHKDQSTMSDSLRGYLASLIEAGIFTSTGSDGKFEGDRPITRAETAIITKASFDYAARNTVSSKVEKKKGTVILSSKLNNVNVIIIEADKQKYSFDLDNNTKFKLKDKDIKLEDIRAGQEVEIEYTKSNSVDREGTAKTVTVTNAMLDMVGYVNSKGTNEITLRYRDNSTSIDFRTTSKISTSDTKTFTLDSNVKIKAYGKDLKLADVNVDDLVEFKTNSDNKITEMTVFPKEAQLKGKITSLDTSNKDKAYLKIRLKDNKDYEFYITNETKDLDRITLNDDVNILVNYKVVKGLADSERNGYVMGTVRRVALDETPFDFDRRTSDPYIDLDLINGGTKTFYLIRRPIIREGNNILENTTNNEKYLRDKDVNLKLNERGMVEEIIIVNRDLQFNAMFQVIRCQRAINQLNTYDVKLKVLQSDNSKLKPGATFDQRFEGSVSVYDVFLANGYLYDNSQINSLSIEKIVGNTSYELDEYKGISYKRDFLSFDQIKNRSTGYYNGYSNSGVVQYR